jgi:hypothetical protein
MYTLYASSLLSVVFIRQIRVFKRVSRPNMAALNRLQQRIKENFQVSLADVLDPS